VDWVAPLVSIIVINLVLSGDNAVVIGLAAHRLPPQQRRVAIVLGGLGAVVLRLVLTAVATLLLLVPGLRQAGGALLLLIAFRLLKVEEESEEGVKQAGTFRDAIITILLADLIMSLDNILGVAAVANGNVPLLVVGLALSMAIVMFGGGLIAELMNRIEWLTYVGAAAIAWTGAEMALRGSEGEAIVALPDLVLSGIAAIVTVVTLGLAHYFHRHLPRRRAMVEARRR
jgi:YjbE family integral membrane protein